MNQGSSPQVQGLNDLKEFEETENALTMLGFSDQDQENLLKILAGILHLGNIEFKQCLIKVENEQDQEGCVIPVSLPQRAAYAKPTFSIRIRKQTNTSGSYPNSWIWTRMS